MDKWGEIRNVKDVDRIKELEDKCDALAAHVEQIHRSAYYASEPPVKHVLAIGPEYSLARRDVRMQAEAKIEAFEGVLAYCKAVPESASNGQRVLRILRERTEAQRTVLRHQAEGGTS